MYVYSKIGLSQRRVALRVLQQCKAGRHESSSAFFLLDPDYHLVALSQQWQSTVVSCCWRHKPIWLQRSLRYHVYWLGRWKLGGVSLIDCKFRSVTPTIG